MVKAEFIELIFAQFLPDLGKRFTIRKLSLLSGISYDAAYRHAHYLIKEGALREEKVGKSSCLGINFKSELARKYIEKAGLGKTGRLGKRDAITSKLLGELVRGLKAAIPNELLCVVLYGSHAKGAATMRSDIDVLIIVSTFEVRGKVDGICGGIEKSYGKPISPLLTTAIEFRKMLESKKATVAHEALLDGAVLCGLEKFYSMVFEAMA